MAKDIKCRISNCVNILKGKGTICGKHRWRKKKFNSYDLPSYNGEPNYYIEKIFPEGTVHKCKKDHGYLSINDVYETKYKDHVNYHCKLCAKDYNIKRNFKDSINLNDYNMMLEKQRGVCAICFKPSTKLSNNSNTFKSLSIDHCHTTNKIRGLLCDNCNQGLGCFFDNIELLEFAIIYLKLSH